MKLYTGFVMHWWMVMLYCSNPIYKCGYHELLEMSLILSDHFLPAFFPAVATTVVSHNPNTTLVISENEDVTISCSHDDVVYEVSVERIGGVDGGSRLLGVCKQNGDGVELSEYSVRREIVNCSDEMELKLRLNNVSEDDGGMYRCNFSTDTGFSSRLILLTMFPGPKGFRLHDTIT